MKLSIASLNATCLHCSKEYQKKRTDQKFCSTKCRSGNWAMNKQSTKAVQRAKIDNANKSSGFNNAFLGSSIAVMGKELLDQVTRTSNEDIIRYQKVILKSQIILGAKLDSILAKLGEEKRENTNKDLFNGQTIN